MGIQDEVNTLSDTAIRRLLVEIVESGNFPDESFDIRHIEKIDGFQITPEGNVRFDIERHPHLFGRSTLGLASAVDPGGWTAW